MEWVANKCGGKSFRTLPDGKVEIDGVGIPTYSKTSQPYKYLKQTWDNWSWLIRWHAFRAGIRPSELLAIATQETGLWSGDKHKQATVSSSAGATGVMQIMPCEIFKHGKYRDLVCGKDRSSPSTSFHIGSVLLGSHLRSFKGLPAAASAYNSGDVRCYEPTANAAVVPNQFNWLNEHDYATKATTYNNTAIEMGVNRAAVLPWILGVGVISFGLVAVVQKTRPQLLRPAR